MVPLSYPTQSSPLTPLVFPVLLGWGSGTWNLVVSRRGYTWGGFWLPPAASEGDRLNSEEMWGRGPPCWGWGEKQHQVWRRCPEGRPGMFGQGAGGPW